MENTGETDRLKLVLSSKVEQVRLQVRDLNTQNQLFKAENEADVTELKIKAVLYEAQLNNNVKICLLYTSPSPRDATLSRMPSSA